MTEKTLSAAIDDLAVRKAREFNDNVRNAVQNALKPFWRGGNMHASDPFFGKTVRAIVRHYIDEKTNVQTNIEPTDEVIDHFRAVILDELLNKMPLVKELALLQADGHEDPT